MKNWLLFGCILLITVAFGQKSPFYQTEDGGYAFQFEGNECKLYELSRHSPEVYHTSQLYPRQEYRTSSDSLGILFSNGSHAISYDYKYFRVLKLKNGKPKGRLTYVAKRVEDPSKIYEAINYVYWEKIDHETIDEAERNFPLFDEYYFSHRRLSWKNVDFKNVEPEQFKVLANQRIELLKDSLEKTNQNLIAWNHAVEQQLDTLGISGLKENFNSRPLHEYAYNQYNSEMLELVAKKRPDLFIDLVDAVPVEKNYLFNETMWSKEARRAIRSYETDSPVKKEFFRYRRKEAFKMGLITTAAATLELGVVGGAITGIVYLFRR